MAFKWRHWGEMQGDLVCPMGPGMKLTAPATHQPLEIFGVGERTALCPVSTACFTVQLQAWLCAVPWRRPRPLCDSCRRVNYGQCCACYRSEQNGSVGNF